VLLITLIFRSSDYITIFFGSHSTIFDLNPYTWTIGAQGGYQAKGIENIPNSDGKEVVRTNGNYGYNCACLNVAVNSNLRRIIGIQGGESLPLSTCREDPNLPKSP
jgi:hypothetical protein